MDRLFQQKPTKNEAMTICLSNNFSMIMRSVRNCIITVFLCCIELNYTDAVSVLGRTDVRCCYLPSRLFSSLLLTEPVSEGCLLLSLSSPFLLLRLVLVFSFKCWSQLLLPLPAKQCSSWSKLSLHSRLLVWCPDLVEKYSWMLCWLVTMVMPSLVDSSSCVCRESFTEETVVTRGYGSLIA